MKNLLLMGLICLFSVKDLNSVDKSILGIYKSSSPHMVGDGFKVYNYFPGTNRLDLSPFILLDYMAPSEFKPTSAKRGVGAHPHRGFETVTFVYEGGIAHRDSKGNGGIIGPGDIQWMTAGSGVLHEEFHEKEFAAKGGILHGIQLWINLPAKDKMTEPRYQTLMDASIPRKEIDKGSYLRVIAGNFEGIQASAKTFSPLEIYDAKLQKGISLQLNLPKENNTFILVLQGSLLVNGNQQARFKDLIAFKHDGETIELKATEESLFLVLSGKPLNEPVVQQGPFVMNNQAEIDQAYKDFQSGKFGKI